MDSQPLVSVIIVVFNAAATLDRSIESVLGQRYKNYELVIIDGGSGDGSVEIVNGFGEKISYFVSEKDNGIYDAMNKGVSAARGEWLYFLGADDIFFDNEVLHDIFTNFSYYKSQFLYGDTVLKSNNRILGGTRTYRELIERNISHQAIFYHSSIFTQIGPYNLRYSVLADYDLNLRIFESVSIKTTYLTRKISLFNDKGGTSNVTLDSLFFRDRLSHFLNVAGLSKNDSVLQQYFFFTGIALLFKNKQIKGLRYCAKSVMNGERKFFFFLLFIKFSLSQVGVLKKLKII